MIYILVGSDHAQKSPRIKAIVKDRERIVLDAQTISKETLNRFADSVSLFGDTPVVIIENMLAAKDITLTKNDLLKISDSPTIFIFLEDKLLKTGETTYKKFATIERFEKVKEKQAPVSNVFALADAYGRRDKINTWILYRQAIEKGTEPEAISGMLFWKIKQILLSGSKTNQTQLKHTCGELVSLYHRSHRGECDFTIGLEQFILRSLS